MYLYAATCFMTLCFTILSSFLSTRNLRIDKNYTLSIFMLSGSIQFYFNIRFNLVCIYIKPCLLYQQILMLFNFACFHFLQFIYHITTCNFNALIQFTIQFMRFKRIHKIPFTLVNVGYFTLTIQITFLTDSV